MLGALKAARKLDEEEYLQQIRAVLESVYLDGIRKGVRLPPEDMNEMAFQQNWKSYELEKQIYDPGSETTGG